jgi:hypothetical protein
LEEQIRFDLQILNLLETCSKFPIVWVSETLSVSPGGVPLPFVPFSLPVAKDADCFILAAFLTRISSGASCTQYTTPVARVRHSILGGIPGWSAQRGAARRKRRRSSK